MSITTALASVTTATATAKKLFDVAQATKHAELKGLIAELMNQPADSKAQMAELKIELHDLAALNDALKRENAELKSAAPKEKPTVK